jgi:hypothetical protein
MGFLSDLNRKRKKVQKKILNPVVKGFSKISDKFIPNELRFLAPYAAGIGTLMLPPGIGPAMRGLYAAGLNAAGQIGADETPIEDISDLNELSMLLAGGLGALGADPAQGSAQGVSGADKAAFTSDAAYSGAAKPEMLAPAKMGIPAAAPDVQPGFFEGVGNVGKKGLEVAQDYVRGTRSDLAGFGKNPGSLFEYNKLGKVLKGQSPLPGLTKAAGALTPTLSLGTADVAYEAAIDAQNAFDAQEAEELRQAGMDEDAIANARRAAIREAMEAAQFTEEEILETFGEIGLKNGGIASLKDGGMLDFGGREMDLRGGGFVPMGKKERADDVPARLSKNEFVMTADAVRAAGGGSVNKGAQRMYDIMNRLEARA